LNNSSLHARESSRSCWS